MKILKYIYRALILSYYLFLVRIKFARNKVRFGEGFRIYGSLYVSNSPGGVIEIGSNVKMSSNTSSNPIGGSSKIVLTVRNKGYIKIGNNVGMSGCGIVSHKGIDIEDDVLIGGDSMILDTDFHPLSSSIRHSKDFDLINSKKIRICKNVFIGTRSIILKGVTIGENSVVGAGSIVTKDIPANEIWAGNPARFIKKIN